MKTLASCREKSLNRPFGNATFFRVQDYVPLKGLLNSRARLLTRACAACDSAQAKSE